MRIDVFRKVSAMCLLCLLLVGMAGCRSARGASDPLPTETAGQEQDSTPSGFVLAHFPTFEVFVPEDWSARGNVGKLYEGDGMFLLAGPLTADGEDLIARAEETLSDELQLFFNTEYYRSQTRFRYEEESSSGTLQVRSGTLFNGRTGSSMRFSGAVDEASGGYFFYFWQDVSGDSAAARRMEVSYESFRAL